MSSTEEQALTELTQKLDSLAVYKRGIISQLKTLNQKGKERQIEFGNIADKLRGEREQLNQLFPKLKEYKEKRIGLVNKLRDIREQAKKVSTTLKGFEKGGFTEDDEVLTQRLNKLEWRLQSERLTREEEREIVESINKLEAKLRRYKKVIATRQEYSGIMGDVKSLRNQLDEIDSAADEIRNEIGKRKEAVHQLVTQREAILDGIKEHGENIGELRQQLDKAYGEFEEIRKKRNELILTMKAKDNEAIMMKRRAYLEKAKDEAKGKLQAGMTLSFDELKLALDEEA